MNVDISQNFKTFHIDNDPFSMYLILCKDINRDDTMIWKFHLKENNFIPVYDLKDASISHDMLACAMENACQWANTNAVNHNRPLPELFLIRTHSSKPWQSSQKLDEMNKSTGIFD